MGLYEIKVWFKDSTCRKFVVTDYYFSDENLELIGSDPIEIIIPKENILYYDVRNFGRGYMDFYMRDYNHQTTVYYKIKSYNLEDDMLNLKSENGTEVTLNLNEYLDWFACDYIGD